MSKLKEDHISLVIDAKTSEAQQKMRQLERATADLRKEMKARQNAMLELEAAGKKETDEYKRLQVELKKYSVQIKENERQLRSMRSTMDTSAMTMVQLRKHAKELQTALNNTSKAANPKEYEHLASQLRSVNGRMSELKADASRLSDSLGKQSGGIASKFSSMFSSISSNWTKLIGMMGAAVASISAIIAGIKWWYNYNTGIEEAQRLTREFTGLAGDELVQVRSRIQAIADTFGKSYKDVLSAVDALMVQYGISAQQATKIVEDGFTSGADLGGNMLSMIKQYGPAFRDAGVGADQLVAIIAQTRSGIFSEGGMALIQMATKRIREMSSSTASSLNAIGVSSKQVQADLKNGTKNIFDIIQQVSAALKKMPQDSQQVGNVLKDVFGRQAAAGGLKMIESLSEMTTKIEDVKKVTGEYGKLQEQQVEAQAQLNEKMSKFFGIGDQGFEELTMKAKIFAMNVLSKIIDYTVKLINYWIDLYNESVIVRSEIETLKFQFKTLWEVVKLGFNLVIDGFKGVARMAKALATTIEGVLSFDVDKIAKGVAGLISSYNGAFAEMEADAKKFGKNVASNYIDSLNNVLGKNKVAHVSVDITPTKDEPLIKPTVTTGGNGGNGGNGGDNKNKGKNKTADHDDALSKQFSHDRAQDLDEAKRAYQEDINALNKALAEKKLTQQQYNAFSSALAIQHQNNLLAIETSYQQRSQDILIEDAAKKKTLQENQDKAVLDQKQAAMNAYIEAEKQYYGNLDKIKEMSKSSQPQTLQQELNAKLLALDGYYKASLQLAKEDGDRQKQVTEAYEKAKAQITTEWTMKAEEQKGQVQQQYGLLTMNDQLAAEKKRLQALYSQGILTKEQYERAVFNIEQDAENHKLQIRHQYGLVSQQELYNAELAQLKQHLDNKEISEEEYEEAVKQMKISKWKESFDYYSKLFGGAFKALQDAEVANVDAKYDAEIEAAKNAGKDTSDLEKKKAEEKLKIQKKYADVNFAIKASQIIADTAVSIMKAYGELGPIAGSIAAALMGITGVAQLAAANAERQKVKKMTLNGTGASSAQSGTRIATGLESGGSIDIEREQDGKHFHAAYDPDRRGYVDRPTVIVGEGPYGRSREWVASNAAVENPTVAPLIDIIDRAQRAGTIRTLDMNKWLVQQAQGRASGGFIGTTPPPTRRAQVDGHRNDKLIARLVDAIDRLTNEGIPAYVGIDELDAKQKIRNQYRNIGKKEYEDN